MALQINQYTKIRTDLTLDNDDLMDLDSTDDAGVSYESAKMTVANLLAFVNANAQNIYIADGTILANRTLTANGNWTKWLLGDVKVGNVADGNSFGFVVEFGVVEMGRYNYDVPSTSANIELKHLILGVPTTYFKAINGKVGIGTETPEVSLDIDGGMIRVLSNLPISPSSGKGLEMFYLSNLDTGRIYSYDRDILSWQNLHFGSSVIGNEVYILGSNGNLGVGTTTPTSKLHVKGGTPSTTKTLLIENSLLNPNFLVRDDGFVGVGTTVQSVGEKMHIEGNLYVGNQTYPSASTIHFAQDFYRMGSVGNGRDFTFYSNYNTIAGGGAYGFNFKFNTYTQLYIEPIQLKHVTLQVNTIVNPLNDISKKIIIQCPYDSSAITINESPTQFNPLGGGYYPSYLDKVLGIRNYAETFVTTDYPDNSVVGLTAFFTRGGSLSMGTDPTSRNQSVRAGVTIKKGIYDCLEIDGVTPIKVRTALPSDTQIIFPFNPNAATPIQLHNGSRIKANGETRTIVSFGKTFCIVDSAVDWNNVDAGYDFEYQNPYLHFTDENDAAVFVVDPIGSVGIGTEVVNDSAKLEIESTTQGLLLPRMTTVQRDAIATPSEGLVIYNLTSQVLNFYNGSVWGAV